MFFLELQKLKFEALEQGFLTAWRGELRLTATVPNLLLVTAE